MLKPAVELPRWLLGRTWGNASDSLKLEARFPAATVEALRAMDHDVELLSDWDESVGHAGALILQPNGLLLGGFDPRSNGGVAAFCVGDEAGSGSGRKLAAMDEAARRTVGCTVVPRVRWSVRP